LENELETIKNQLVNRDKQKDRVFKTFYIVGDEDRFRHDIAALDKEVELDPESVYPIFNLATSYYHVAQYEDSIKYFEQVESRLPRRALWYQIEPILAYKELGNYDRVFQISNWLFENDNRAFSELYQIRGEIYLEKGDKEAARKEFELALKYNKNFQPAKDALQNL